MNLRHAELKAERAREHLDLLKQELQAYYDSGPCSISRCHKPELARRFLRIQIKPLSDRTYMLVGDFAHNLRSALDHIVYSLATKGLGRLPDSNAIQWPVVEATTDQKTFSRQTRGVSGAALSIIESFQPYHLGTAFKQHPLWQLHKLDIVDKHRRVAINENEIRVGFPTLTASSDFSVTSGGGCIEFSFPIDAPPIEMAYTPRPEFRFGAAEEDLFLTIDRLEEIYKFVSITVLCQFSNFFEQAETAGPSISTSRHA